MRKIIVWISCFVMLFALAMPAFAAQQMTFALKPSATEAAPGDTVEFTVTISGEAYSSAGYIPAYDTTVWEMVKGECLFEDAPLKEFSLTEGGVVLLNSTQVRDGDIFRFTMKVKADAPAGETKISGTVAANNGNNALSAALTDAKITVKTAADAPAQTTEEPTEVTQEVTAATEETKPQNTEATMQSQPVAPDQTQGSVEGTQPVEKETGAVDLGGGDACLGAEDLDMDTETIGAIEKEEDHTLWWVAAIAVVAVAAVAAWFLLRKKENKE